ncbi:MAG: SDR family oxidoreductase [Edaphobacter sp.]
MVNSRDSGVALSLEGKVALITGGSRGIGAATVRLFRRAGAKVAFSYQSAAGRAEELVAECGGATVCHAIRHELATPEDGRLLVESAVKAFGRLDCLIVNHGVWPSHEQPIETMAAGQWRKTLEVNLDSSFGLVQAATAQMLAQRQEGAARGHIVLISSSAGQRGEAFHADYAASKGAIISLTKSLSTELIGRGIYCNCVAPGWTATEMVAGVFDDPERARAALSLIPIGRPGHVDEIAGPILFLCTPFAGFISGEIVNVNGGAVLAG